MNGLTFACQVNRKNDVWYTVVVPASGTLTVETDTTTGTTMMDSVLSVFSGTCGSLTEVGCDDDEDCIAGYFCDKSSAQPFCSELNECLPNNGHFEGLLYCGQNTICTNNIGSFNCTCKTGFYDFSEHSGCIDNNE